MLGRVTFFGERSSQLRGCVVAVAGGLVTVGDVVCPSACCCECVSVGECEIVDDGDSGPMFVTNSGPMLGGGIGDPGGSGAELGVRDSKKPGALRFAFGSSGVSLVSRECVWRFESDAKGSSPTSDVVLPLSLPRRTPCAPRNALGGCGCEAEVGLGPMTSSMILLRSTADAAFSGSTRLLGWPGGGQTASRKMDPVSARMPRRWGTAAPAGRPLALGVGARCGSMGAAMSDGPGEEALKSRESGDRPGLSFVMEREWA